MAISCLPLTMISFALAGLPCLAVAAHPHLFSFQLHLRHHPSAHNLTAASSSSPSSSRSTPMLFSEPLTPTTTTTTTPPRPSASADANTVGTASGLYLYDATSAQLLSFFFFTATLGLPRSAQSGTSPHCSAAAAICRGSLMLMGNADSGAVAVVGGTRDFAYASGQAKVTILPRSSDPAALSILFDVEVQYPSSIALQ